MPCFARVSGIIVICSEITDCGKSEQNGAYCCYLLVVKLVVKWNGVLLMVFEDLLYPRTSYWAGFVKDYCVCFETYDYGKAVKILQIIAIT